MNIVFDESITRIISIRKSNLCITLTQESPYIKNSKLFVDDDAFLPCCIVELEGSYQNKHITSYVFYKNDCPINLNNIGWFFIKILVLIPLFSTFKDMLCIPKMVYS
jgi:hypothetical protein